jgi:hypothetical protein
MWDCIKIAVTTVALFYGTLWVIAFIYACFKERKELKEVVNHESKRFSTFDKCFYGFFILLFALNFILN